MASRSDSHTIQRKTNSIDRAIAKQLRRLRSAAGISEEDCARQIGVSVEQLEQYERGAERVTASHLVLLAQVLGVPVAAFFEKSAPSSKGGRKGNVRRLPPAAGARMREADLEERLLYCFRTIKDAEDRKLIADLAARLSDECRAAGGA